MKRLRFTILFMMLTVAAAVWAQASLTLQAPRQAIEGRNFTVTVRLTNGSGSAPQAPQIEGCTLKYGPSTSTMSSTQIINGQMSQMSTIDYTFTYRAVTPGDYTIPAVSTTVNGKPMSSQSASITILPADQTTQPSAPGQPAPNPSDAGTPISKDDMFVRISLSKQRVYEQEAVVATVKLYTQLNISSFRITVQPTFEGFLSEELPVPNTNDLENYNGRNYVTAVLKRCILYPQKSGKLTITSGKYDVTVEQYENVTNGFFITRRPVSRNLTTESNTATIDVMPLPEPRPAAFNGAVGKYSVSTELKPLELRTNEAASYVYTINGTGNIKYLKTPTIDIPAGIDQFTPKTESDAKFTGSNMSGTYTVTYTLVPQDPGTYDFPASEFCYFDPSDREYHTIELPSYQMRVAQGATTSAITEQKVINKGMTDIYHIKPITAPLVKEPRYVFNELYYWMLYLGAALALVLVIIVYRRHLRLSADVQGRKLAKANKLATKRFRAARAAMGKDADTFYAEINKALWGYLSDKLAIPSSQLTRDNIAAELTSHGVAEDDVAQVIDILDRCEMARFTPHTDSEMSQLYSQAVSAVKSIERNKK